MAANPGPRLGIQRSWGFILLAILLIIWGAAGLVHLTFEGLSIVEYLLAIVSGVLILFGA